MNDFLRIYILAKLRGNAYLSVSQIARQLGIPVNEVDDMIWGLIEDEKLEYQEQKLFLTEQGRLALMYGSAEFLDFEAAEFDYSKITPQNAWTEEQIYLPKNFEGY